MINLNKLDRYRDRRPEILRVYGSAGDDTCGSFMVPSKIDKALMRVFAAAGAGWDHVSVSRKNRCPNWEEMSQIKKLFFHHRETVVQFHVPEEDHINFHPFTLHMWRSWSQQYELPPSEFVGPNGINPEDLRKLHNMPSGLYRDLLKRNLYK